MRESLIFRKVSSIEPVIEYLTKVISENLAEDRKVLWLVPGGSAMKVAVEVAKRLPKENLKNLIVTLTDERYGPVGHADSNWPQLEQAGFKLEEANRQPVLTGKNLEETAKDYAKILEGDLKIADFSIALAGMGPDGHIFGIKPHSPSVDGKELVVGYKWDDYVRLTPTFEFLQKLDEVVIYAVGEEKWPQIDALDKNLSDNEQPAQMLKRLKKVILFNDYKGEEA